MKTTPTPLSRMMRQTALCLSLTLAIGAAGAPPARAQTVDFAVAAGSLQAALTDFGVQSGVQILFDSSLTSGQASRGVQGALSVQAALDQLLAGTGLDYQFTSSGAVVLRRQSAVVGDLGPSDFVLGAVEVVGAGSGAASPYYTAGAASHVEAETIQHYRGSTVSDIFRGTPGVMSGNARSGGAGVDVNVRGMQGFGRVATTIDGAENGISVYQGYQGSANRSYVDPDFISSIDINRGSDVASRGIAGSVAMRTLRADDILGEGENVGYRLRFELGGNTTDPTEGALAGYAWPGSPYVPGVATPSATGMDRPSGGEVNQGSFSLIGAMRDDQFDMLLGYAYRRQGNYFAGEDGPGAEVVDTGPRDVCNAYNFCQHWDTFLENGGLTNYRLGEEVLNTELETHSVLFNATRRFGDDATLQLGYNGYFSETGDILASRLNGVKSQALQGHQTTGTSVNTVTARYRWDPYDNDMVDLRANFWLTQLAQRQQSRAALPTYADLNERYRVGVDVQMLGGDVSNSSAFDLGTAGNVTLNYGISYKDEEVNPSLYSPILNSYALLDGSRTETSAHVQAVYEPTDWLTATAGLRYTYVDQEDRADYSLLGVPYFELNPYRSGGGFSPSLGLTWSPTENTQVYANWSSTERYASLYESAMVSSFVVAPISIAPERANNWEVGVNHVQDGLFSAEDSAMFKLSYFNWSVEDYIGRQWAGHLQPSGSTWWGMEMLNLDRAEFEGLELSTRYQNGGFTADFGASYFLDMQFCLTAGVCDTKTLYSDFATNHVPPEYTLDLAVSQRLMDDRLTLGGRVSYVGPRAIGHGQVTATGMSQFISLVEWKPYTLVDLFTEYRVTDDVTLSFRVENATDQYYVDPLGLVTQPGPGRTFYVGLTNTFGAGGDLPRVFSGNLTDRSQNGAWSGLYAGAFSGGAIDRTEVDWRALDGSTSAIIENERIDDSIQSLIAGGQVGYNWQFGNGLVLGVQGDFSRGDGRGDFTTISTEGSLTGLNQIASRVHQDIDWNAALNLRAGYALSDDVLLYGLAGVARQGETWYRDGYKSDYGSKYVPNGNTTALTEVEQISVTRNGVNIGIGAEYALNDNWSVWGQINRTVFRRQSVEFNEARAGTSLSYTEAVQTGSQTVEVPANPEFCELYGFMCEGYSYETPIYDYVPRAGTYDDVSGREGRSALTTDGIRIGVNYRF